jgi:hypothetical protein
MTLILTGALALLIVLVEAVSLWRRGQITFLTGVHALILIGYCLPPFMLWLLPGTPWGDGIFGAIDPNPWGVRLYILDLADHLRLPEGAFVTLSIILYGAYAALLAGYFLGSRLRVSALDGARLPVDSLLAIGAGLGVVAVAALVLYSLQFDGILRMIYLGPQVRAGDYPTRWGFLQVLAQLALPAYLILIAVALRMSGWQRQVLLLFAACVWLIAASRTLHASGRLEMGSFLAIPVLAWIFLQRSNRVTVLALIGLGLCAVIVAGIPHNFARNPLEIGLNTLVATFTRLSHHLTFLLGEFAFPHIAAAHTLTVVPDPIAFRHFIDLPLGLAYMLPNFAGVETLPPMILSLHVKLLPWIPVDLFSFGYYSLGTLGVLITFAAFGALLALFDGWLTESVGWLGQALRAAWLFYLPFRLFYADPYAAMQSGFGLIAGTIMVAALAAWTGWRRGKA